MKELASNLYKSGNGGLKTQNNFEKADDNVFRAIHTDTVS